MGLFNTLERALIWNGVREGFYQMRRRGGGSRQWTEWSGATPPSTTPQRGTVVVTFECPEGHQHPVSYSTEALKAQVDRLLSSEVCPVCHSYCRWRTMDQRIENTQVP